MAEIENDKPADIEEEKIADPETPENTGGFKFASFREFLKFVEYAGEGLQLEFAAPILDSAGAVLVQKGLHCRPGLIKNLWQFFNQGNLNENIVIADTKQLHAALRDKICRQLFRCLDPGRFHVAQALADASLVNIKAVTANIIQRHDVLPVFLKLDQMQDPVLPHLGEVALVAGGFAEQYCRAATNGKTTRETVRTAIFAGLLHDISLCDDDDFLAKDIEKIRESNHAKQSADAAKQLIPGLAAAITDIIEHHHRDDAPFDAEAESLLPAQNIAGEALALSEYVFVQLRSQYRKDEAMNSAELLFYDLGRAFGQGKFHPQFRKITSRLWENLFATLYYGYEIGKVESRCPYKPSAIAYPTPRCTQIMCHAHVTACANYDSHLPLEILQTTRFPGRPGVMIQPGKYAKCKLAADLPKEISRRSGAEAWLSKGKEKPPAT